jgi:exodeoxyribonuclease VII small subunit
MTKKDEIEALPTPEQLKYSDAIKELRQILQGIENEEVGLDALSVQVERAALLIRTCRDRIDKTDMRVRRVLEELETKKEGEDVR